MVYITNLNWLVYYLCFFPLDLLDQVSRAQADADGLRMKLQTSDEELATTNAKFAALTDAFQLACEERDDAISQIKKMKESYSRNEDKELSKQGTKDGADEEFLQQQCTKLKKYVICINSLVL